MPVRQLLPFAVTLTIACSLISCRHGLDPKSIPDDGRFHNEPHLISLGPNLFFFDQPSGKPPFSYTTSTRTLPGQKPSGQLGAFKHKGVTITPGPMLTTGASVPRRFWDRKGLGALDFVRAALIHDWLFVAHQRLANAQRQGNERVIAHYDSYRHFTLDDAADIYAEAVHTSMRESRELASMLKEALRQREIANPDLAVAGRIKNVLESFEQGKGNSFILRSHHQATSSAGILGNRSARRMWDAHHDDAAFFALLAHQAGNPYLSSETRQRFSQIAAEMKKEEAEFQEQMQRDLKQLPALRPRVYLEVADSANEALTLKLRRLCEPHGIDVKTASKSSSVPADEMRVLYYVRADQEHETLDKENEDEARKLLDLILSALPPEARPAAARIQPVDAGRLRIKVRPKHFDLRLGSDQVERLLQSLPE